MLPDLPLFFPLFIPLFLLDLCATFCTGIAMQNKWAWRILLVLQVFFVLLLILELIWELPATLFQLAIATACLTIETISLFYSSRGKFMQLAFCFSVASNILLLFLGFMLLGVVPFQ